MTLAAMVNLGVPLCTIRVQLPRLENENQLLSSLCSVRLLIINDM